MLSSVMVQMVGVAAWNVYRHPGLVEKRRAGLASRRHDQRGAEIGERVAAFLVVIVDETREEDRRLVVLAAIEHQAAEVDQPVRGGAHHRVGARLVPLQRRRQTGLGLILGVSRQQRAGPALAAVFRLEQPQPRIAGFRLDALAGDRIRRAQPRDVDAAVVVRSAEEMKRIARRRRERRFVLPLQEWVPVRERGTGHHVHVAARDLRADGRQCKGDRNRNCRQETDAG